MTIRRPERERLRELVGRARERFGTEGWTSDALLTAAKESDSWRNMLFGLTRRKEGAQELDRSAIGYRIRGLENQVVSLTNGNNERLGDFRIVSTGAVVDHLTEWKVEEVRHA